MTINGSPHCHLRLTEGQHIPHFLLVNTPPFGQATDIGLPTCHESPRCGVEPAGPHPPDVHRDTRLDPSWVCRCWYLSSRHSHSQAFVRNMLVPILS